MAKQKTLEQKIDALTGIVEKGFAAVAEDMTGLATKDQIIALIEHKLTLDIDPEKIETDF